MIPPRLKPDFFVEVTWTIEGPKIQVHGTAPVLVVEDNPVVARLLSYTLSAMGFRVEVVTDGQQAIEALKKSDYVFVLMDCHMPGMDGLEATMHLRNIEAETGRHTIVIGCSAGCDRPTCLAAGMDDFLPKPVTVPVIAEKICNWYGSFAA